MRCSLFALALLTSTSAYAAEPVASVPIDHSFIHTVPCSATVRSTLIGVVNQPTMLSFPPSQQFYQIVETFRKGDNGKLQYPWRLPTGQAPKGETANSGETAALEVHNITLWPSAPGVTVMSIIIVDKDGRQQVCAFRAEARSADHAEDPDVTYNALVTLGAPALARSPHAQPSHAAVMAWKAQRAAAADLKTETALAAYDSPTCGWHAQGRRPNALAPMCPMSNGEWTLIRFPGLTDKPAVYILDAAGTPDSERLAPQHAWGDFVVVEAIAPRLRLRLGQAVLDLVNDHYDPVGHPSDTGTVDPTLRRDLIHGQPVTAAR